MNFKNFIPAAIKQPIRIYLDKRSFRAQPKLIFDGRNLKRIAATEINAAMLDPSIESGFAEDHARIGGVYGRGEVFGGVNPGDRRAIYHLIAALKPTSVLEIGTHVAASTLYIASALRRFVEGGALITADIVDVNDASAAWKQHGLHAPPALIARELGLDERVTFLTKPASQVLGEPSNRFDFIFLDGDHRSSAVYGEISLALKKLNPGGVILLHDFYPGLTNLTPDGGMIAGPAIAAERIAQETTELSFIPLGNLPWPTKAGGHGTSLALVARV